MCSDAKGGHGPISRQSQMSLHHKPRRGSLVIVNFAQGGAFIRPEMTKSGRPCVVVDADDLRRGRLVTVVPLSSSEPDRIEPYHHQMGHRSFRDSPLDATVPRWAKCDMVQTVSLDRVTFPYRREQNRRRYVKTLITAVDLESIIASVLYALNVRRRDLC